MKKYIYALGFFDGVHLGHQKLLLECCRLSSEYGYTPAAMTFDRHPKSLFTQTPTVLISTIPDRKLLLGRYGMEQVHVLTVVPETMGQPWRQFLDGFLREGAAGFVCGDDFRFGHRGEGNAEKLQDFCREQGLPCTVIPEQALEDVRISSTFIRRQIESGNMSTAVKFLGHPYTLTGRVVPGRHPDHPLGIPTDHIRLPAGLAIPKFGVYACCVLIDGVRYPAITNIGARSPEDGEGIIVEPWILDNTQDLRGREITIEFYKFLRGEQDFPSLDALRAEIRRNAEEARLVIQREFT